ncbi:MAG: phosphate-starvation-inducible PsiE family protein [Halobacteriales archaeon]
MRVKLSDVTEPSGEAMRWLVLLAAYFLLLLFLIGVFDLLLGLYELITSGEFTDPLAVIKLLNSVLLLLIIVEVHRTLVAYVRKEPLIRIVIGAAIIAIAREIISFRVGGFDNPEAALTAAGSFALLLVALVLAYTVVLRTGPEVSGDE